MDIVTDNSDRRYICARILAFSLTVWQRSEVETSEAANLFSAFKRARRHRGISRVKRTWRNKIAFFTTSLLPPAAKPDGRTSCIRSDAVHTMRLIIYNNRHFNFLVYKRCNYTERFVKAWKRTVMSKQTCLSPTDEFSRSLLIVSH